MHIAIIDDDQLSAKKIQNRLEYLSQDSHTIHMFYDGKTFLEASSYHSYDLVYINIEMQEINEIEVKCIEKNVIIIFITGYMDYKHAYIMDAFQYLPKPNGEQVFDLEFQLALKYHQNTFQKIAFKTYSGVYLIPLQDIIYIETAYKNYKVRTINSIHYGTIKQLKDMRKQLCQYQFMQVHRSYTINMNHVVKLVYRDIYMSNGEIIPLSRSKVKEFKAFGEF